MPDPKPILEYGHGAGDRRRTLDRLDRALTLVLGLFLLVTLFIVMLTWAMLLFLG